MASKDKMLEEGAEEKKSASARLEELLGYGRFQKFHVYVTSSLVSFIGAINMLALIFTVTRKPFRCSLPEKIESR
jgi:hypothetical protein